MSARRHSKKHLKYFCARSNDELVEFYPKAAAVRMNMVLRDKRSLVLRQCITMGA
jgi:hypothetical protein